MTRTRLLLALVLLALTAGAQYPGGEGPPGDALYLVPDAIVPLQEDAARPVQQYPGALLAAVPALEDFPRRLRSRVTAVRDTRRIAFRELEAPAAPSSRNDVEGLPEGDYLVGFWGPIDPAWRDGLASPGLAVLDNAAPYGLLVRRGRGLFRAGAKKARRPRATRRRPAGRALATRCVIDGAGRASRRGHLHRHQLALRAMEGRRLPRSELRGLHRTENLPPHRVVRRASRRLTGASRAAT